MKSKVLLGVIIISGLVICFWNIPAFAQQFAPGAGAPGNLPPAVGGGDEDRATPQFGQGQQRHVDAQAEEQGDFVRQSVHVRMEYIDTDGDGIPDMERMTQTGNRTIRTEDGQEITNPIDTVQIQQTGRFPYGSGLFEITETISRSHDGETPDVFQVSYNTQIDNTGHVRAMEILVRSVGQDGNERWVVIRRSNITYDGLGRVSEYDETQEEITAAEAQNWLNTHPGATIF